jgi:hypothetical protein
MCRKALIFLNPVRAVFVFSSPFSSTDEWFKSPKKPVQDAPNIRINVMDTDHLVASAVIAAGMAGLYPEDNVFEDCIKVENGISRTMAQQHR